MLTKWQLSDWMVTGLGTLGIILGLMGLCHPASQYEMMGVKASSLPPGSVIPALFGSGSLSALYVGILYIYGSLKKWKNFKPYLIFARMVMCLGFLVFVCTGKAPKVLMPAAIWEGTGALLILLTLWWDHSRNAKITS